MKLETQVWSDDNVRRSDIGTTDDGYYVALFENDEHVRTVDLTDKSSHYAYDTAENWVLGIIKE